MMKGMGFASVLIHTSPGLSNPHAGPGVRALGRAGIEGEIGIGWKGIDKARQP